METNALTHTSGPTPVVRFMQIGEHVLFVALLAVGAIRAAGSAGAPALLGGIGLLLWYALGVLLARRRAQRSLGIVWLAVLGLGWVALVILSSDYAWVAFALFFLAFHLLGRMWALAATVAITAIAITVLLRSGPGAGWPVVIGPVFGAAVAIGMSLIYAQLVADAAERTRLIDGLRSAQKELLDAQDELGALQREIGATDERTRLAQEIHDTVAQGLSSITMMARSGIAGPGDRENPLFAQIEQVASENLVEARRVVHALSPPELDEAPLAAALERQVAQVREQTALEADLVVDGVPRALPMADNVALLRVAQSALANVRQHARANRVRLTLSFQIDEVSLDIVDDGCGFDPSSVPEHSESGGYGLRAMRRRIRERGGTLVVESEPGDGTAVAATLPAEES
ncbi:sensor histidine kinase [Spelaeicoccus albus]|uniref:Oxygen sensor histidine kinase NreB n=1 Tax=Spelaeicoccus albus TaxID=1280376 RepID=A0A7Z0D2R0_9MICO|nr:sensor histidine kinase [Spelaeicoccus albus]NYI67797.1 signal transduction histidine kinase [Spelaeicoccus albus]